MSNFTLNIAFDAATIATAARIAAFEVELLPHLSEAMKMSLDDIEYEAVNWMDSHFMNPTGQLESAWDKVVFGPYDAEIENTSPYGQRRNYGFSGMTDALGRYYPYDPGIAWAENAVANAFPAVETNFRIAVDKTIAGI